MSTKQGVLASALAGVALIVTAGCGSMDHRTDSTTTTTTSTRISARQMCQEAGGTYNQGQCSPARTALTSKQLCESRGGTYFDGGDYCEVPPIRTRQ
jgi:hypothetical protein